MMGKTDWYLSTREQKLEQLECLHSENNTQHLMITHTFDSYQMPFIPSQNKTESNLQI